MINNAVSIICPYRNAALFLPGLIENVQKQTYAHWELLLVDDESTDNGSLIAAKAAMSDPRIRALSADSRPSGFSPGPWWPRNVGLRNAQFQLIAFLDVDDLWHPLKLQRQLSIHLNADASLSVTGYGRFDHLTRKIIGWRNPPLAFGYRRLRVSNVIPMLSVLVDRSLLVEQFAPCPHEDYLFWLSILRINPGSRCIGIPELLSFYSVHDKNLTRQRWKMPLWVFQVYRAHGLSGFESLMSLFPWAISQLYLYSLSKGHVFESSVDQLIARPKPLSISSE